MEHIIITSSLNATETLRSLALNGKDTMGLRVMSPLEFARTALMRSGISVTKDFLPRKDEAALIDTFIREIPYFKTASFADSEDVAAALFTLRTEIPEKEAETIGSVFVNGEFPDKNKAIAKVYERFIKELNDRGLIDTIGLIRLAIEKAKQFFVKINTVKEFVPSALEKKLVERLSGKGFSEISLTDLYEMPFWECYASNYLESYGAANEVERVVAYIIENGWSFDRCTIAAANSSKYSELFYEYSLTHGIDVTFGCGIPITNTYPARLLRVLSNWDTTGFHGLDAFSEVIMNEATDREKLMNAVKVQSMKELKVITEIIGNLKCDCDFVSSQKKLKELHTVYETYLKEHEDKKKGREYKDRNDRLNLLPSAELLIKEISYGFSSFIRKYSVIRKEPSGRIDRAAVNVICDSIDAYVAFSESNDISELVPELLNKTVCSERSAEGALFVTDIRGAFSTVREHLFVMGLSADNFPGKPSENHLLLDSDLELIGAKRLISTQKINDRKQLLKDLIGLTKICSGTVNLSYSSYNPAEMSISNPSSVLFEIFRQERGEDSSTEDFEKCFAHTGYFECAFSRADAAGKRYSEGDVLAITESEPETSDFSVPLSKKGYSPTELDIFFDCPRKYFLNKVIGIEEEEEADPFVVIDAKQTGTLAHSIMEWLAENGNKPSKTEFLKYADKAFDTFLKEYVPFSKMASEKEKKTFLEMMGHAYDSDPKNMVLGAEEKVTVPHESGVNLYGFPDRVEKDKDGKFLIADFKTGRRIKHKKDDIETCLQVVVYSYMMEKLGTPVSYSEYRYLRKKADILCTFNDELKEKLNDKLTFFKTALENGDFPVNPGEKDEHCRFCKFSDICEKQNETEEG